MPDCVAFLVLFFFLLFLLTRLFFLRLVHDNQYSANPWLGSSLCELSSLLFFFLLFSCLFSRSSFHSRQHTALHRYQFRDNVFSLCNGVALNVKKSDNSRDLRLDRTYVAKSHYASTTRIGSSITAPDSDSTPWTPCPRCRQPPSARAASLAPWAAGRRRDRPCGVRRRGRRAPRQPQPQNALRPRPQVAMQHRPLMPSNSSNTQLCTMTAPTTRCPFP